MRSLTLLLKLSVVAATSRSTRVFYDRVSPFYELLFTDHLPHIQTMEAAVTGRFSAEHQIRVLDMACGTGALTRRLEERGFRVAALDFSFESLRRLKQTSRTSRLIQADAAVLPFGSGCFDVVTCMGAWRHFSEPQRVLHEICRVLRPGGVFLVGYFPPKLGGILSIPSGRLGKAVVFLYGHAMRLLSYIDRIDQALEREALQMIGLAFAMHRLIPSHQREYLIIAESPRSVSG